MSGPVTPTPLLLGHRGAKLYAPENTFAAFDLALTHGCDGFEFDVRRTVDGQAVVVHDQEVSGLQVAKSTLLELREASHQPLPTLEEVWRRYHAHAFLDVELKVSGLAQDVARLWRELPPNRGGLVSSFIPEVLEEVQVIAPGIPLGYICRDPQLLDQWRKLPINYAVLQSELLNDSLMNELHDAGKALIVWTLNDDASLQRFQAEKVAALISDDTRLMAQVIRPRAL